MSCLKKNIALAALACTAVLPACKEEDPDALRIKIYTGPVVTARNITTLYSDSARPKVRIFAKVQFEYVNGDREFPEGIKVEFYDPATRQITSHLLANYAKYDRSTDIYFSRGNVIVENFVEHKKLMSEELNWDRIERRVYNDKFVRIETPQETLTGTGLTAAQDFSTYRILKPSLRVSHMEML